ncbi:unnamed protein product [Paramecium pentaurelia]|uniref:Protein kinase domain-containing protein n=1 Tax=Paramecium pentaurelia TaxID=43138 RepID=A0A8S1TQQ0_9CILI|nr:unnamed protein product [Paramecium pentaurelia]
MKKNLVIEPDQSNSIQQTIFRNGVSVLPMLVKKNSIGLALENIPRTQTFSRQMQQSCHNDSVQQSRTPTMKNDSFYGNIFKKPTVIKKPTFNLTKPNSDFNWPLFKIKNDPLTKQFWDRRTNKDLEKNWVFEDYIFASNMLRIGKKKKIVKGYFYRLTSSGLLMYYKKESDTLPKGFIQLDMQIRIVVSFQKTKRNLQLPVLYLERNQGIGITIFDHLIDQTLKLGEQIQQFCLMRGFNVLYEQLELLGSGAFASVFKVTRKRDEKYFAAKTYFKQFYDDHPHKDRLLSMVYNEITTLKNVDHQNIMKLYEVIQEKDKLILIMEYCAGGTLYSYVKQKVKFNDKHYAYILKQLCDALYEMHRLNFVHRDLKLENIMLESKDYLQLKLVDFGFSEIINEKQLVSQAGTPGFLPPEIFRQIPYTAKSDIFSLGVIMYLIVAGYMPFKAPTATQILELNRKCQVNFDKSPWQDVNPDLKYLIKKMLEFKIEDRISCQEILESPYILYHSRQTSETNYKSNQILSGLELDKCNRQSMKSIKQSEQSNDRSKEFQLDFSIHTNDIKSLYQRNSQKTNKSNRSINSLAKNSSQKKISRSVPKECQLSKFQSTKKMEDQESHKSQSKKQSSFGDVLIQQDQKIITFEDTDSLKLEQILYLKRSGVVFNKVKKPFIQPSNQDN